MKTNFSNFIVLFTALIFNSILSYSQETKQTIKITNVNGITGNLYIGWYNSAESFPINDKAIYRKKIKVDKQKEISVDFANIPYGKYAIAVFLDENDNYKLDKNLFGIPREKYGFSNNILPALRPAKFEESVFDLKQQTTIINIKLK